MQSERTSSMALHARTLSDDGIAFLDRAIDPALIEATRFACLSILERKRTDVTRLPLEQYGREPFATVRAALVEVASPIVEVLLGSKAMTGGAWIRASTSMRDHQIHRDVPAGSPPLGAIGLDLLLTDFTAENGATAFWPGTHLLPDESTYDKRRVNDRAATRPPIRLLGCAGTVVLRDLRAWHRAMPNATGEARVMLSFELMPAARSRADARTHGRSGRAR